MEEQVLTDIINSCSCKQSHRCPRENWSESVVCWNMLEGSTIWIGVTNHSILAWTVGELFLTQVVTGPHQKFGLIHASWMSLLTMLVYRLRWFSATLWRFWHTRLCEILWKILWDFSHKSYSSGNDLLMKCPSILSICSSLPLSVTIFCMTATCQQMQCHVSNC